MKNTPKHITEVSEVKKTEGGVRIEITSTEKQVESAVQTMVENCRQGACDCMSPEMKQRITGMEFQKIGGQAAIAITGNISVEEIKGAMERSRVDLCCTIDENKAGHGCC